MYEFFLIVFHAWRRKRIFKYISAKDLRNFKYYNCKKMLKWKIYVQ